MNIKQILVMRRDLKCRRGKEIAQCSHASISFLTKHIVRFADESHRCYLDKEISDVEWEWLNGLFTKVCVRVNSLEELLEIKQKAEDAGLEVHLITDSGKTEFHGVPTETCLAIGPDYSERIDPITGDLKLL